jgi:hypothetical protein
VWVCLDTLDLIRADTPRVGPRGAGPPGAGTIDARPVLRSLHHEYEWAPAWGRRHLATSQLLRH